MPAQMLSSLATELLEQIGHQLPRRDLKSLRRTCRHICLSLESVFFSEIFICFGVGRVPQRYRANPDEWRIFILDMLEQLRTRNLARHVQNLRLSLLNPSSNNPSVIIRFQELLGPTIASFHRLRTVDWWGSSDDLMWTRPAVLDALKSLPHLDEMTVYFPGSHQSISRKRQLSPGDYNIVGPQISSFPEVKKLELSTLYTEQASYIVSGLLSIFRRRSCHLRELRLSYFADHVLPITPVFEKNTGTRLDWLHLSQCHLALRKFPPELSTLTSLALTRCVVDDSIWDLLRLNGVKLTTLITNSFSLSLTEYISSFSSTLTHLVFPSHKGPPHEFVRPEKRVCRDGHLKELLSALWNNAIPAHKTTLKSVQLNHPFFAICGPGDGDEWDSIRTVQECKALRWLGLVVKFEFYNPAKLRLSESLPGVSIKLAATDGDE